jgi:hypothetical protein
MTTISITTTCLYDCYNDTFAKSFKPGEALPWLNNYLESLEPGLFDKFVRAEKRFVKGTARGVKIFYSPSKGKRYYLWINISKTYTFYKPTSTSVSMTKEE